MTKQQEAKLDLIIEMLEPVYNKEKKRLRLSSYKGRIKGSRGDVMRHIINKVKEGGNIGVMHSALLRKLSYYADTTTMKSILKELVENKVVEKNGKMWRSCEIIAHNKSPESGNLDWIKDVC